MKDRLDGLSTTLLDKANVQVEELIVDGKLDDTVLVEDIRRIYWMSVQRCSIGHGTGH